MSAGWLPLESNPDSFNAFIDNLGIKGALCVDVLGFEEELIQPIPQPHLALILVYPEYTTVGKIMRPIYEKLAKEGITVPKNAFFMKQKIPNACGTFALFHALIQNEKELDLGNGAFKEWLDEAKALSVEDRSDSLAKCTKLSLAHTECGQNGETDVTSEVDHHFIAFVNIDGTLYEFDSRMDFPRPCGPTSAKTLIMDAGAECRKLSQQLDGNISFSAIALIGAKQ